MITFAAPVQIITSSKTFSQLAYILEDSLEQKIVQVRFQGIPTPLVLWQGDAYQQAGNYTQADVDAAIKSALGSNPAQVLATLFNPVIARLNGAAIPAPAAPAAPKVSAPAAPAGATATPAK